MKTLILVTLLALAALCLCQGEDSNSPPDSRRSEAFISKQDSASTFEKRQKRNYVHNRLYDVVVSPLESQREVCEFNPDCDELADHIGFQEAYRRFYGPV